MNHKNQFLEQFVEPVADLKQLNLNNPIVGMFVHIAFKTQPGYYSSLSSRKDQMAFFDKLVEFLRKQAKT